MTGDEMRNREVVSFTLAERINQVCDQFESCWQMGRRPEIEDRLVGKMGRERALLVCELLAIELHWRRKAGEQPTAGEYLERLSGDAEAVRAAFGRTETLGLAADPALGPHSTRPGVVAPASDQGDELDRGPPAPGVRVGCFGDYELIRELGHGGMGVVYKAWQISLNRPVALKMIRSAALASVEEVRRFENEAEAVAQLDHPNIVPIFEVGQFKDRHYFSMRLIAGKGLDKRLEDSVGDPQRAARLMVLVAGAIHHAHQRGILHRDLKPANIVVDAEGQPHVTDFGLAKWIEGDSELTHTGEVLGTPAYMAPEQTSARRGVVTTATDVYGLGAILYALLTGRGPFGGATALETLDQVRQCTPKPPRSLNPRVPCDLEVICLKCLEKAPSRRYASAAALREDLARWLEGQPILARPVSTTERVFKWMRRRPAITVMGAAILLLALVGVAGILWEWQTAEANAENARDQERKAILARNEAEQQTKKTASERAKAVLAREEAERQRDVARRNSYLANMNMALREWNDSHVARVVDLLEGERPGKDEGDLRGFEWYYLNRLCHSASQTDTGHAGGVKEAITFKGHAGGVHGVAFSPDGTRIASAGGDGTVKIWDTTARSETRALKGHAGAVRGVAFNPDGTRIVSAGGDGTVKVWDATTGRESFTLNGHNGPVSGVAFCPDGTLIASAGADNTVRIWNAPTRRESFILRGHSGGVRSVAFSPDGTRIVSGSDDKMAKVWDVATGSNTLTLENHTAAVTGAAFSPDSTRIASASWDGTVRVWDATSGHELRTLRGHASGVNGIAFSPDGRRIASAGANDPVKVWDAITGREALTLKGQVGVTGVAFSPDGTRIATASEDGTMKVWDVTTGRESRTLKGHNGPVSGVAFSPDGRRIVSAGGDGTVKVWDVTTGRESLTLKGHIGPVFGVAFSPDGKQIASAGRDKTIAIWDARDK